MWDSAVTLEVQGMITVVMMLEGDFLMDCTEIWIFEWIASSYGHSVDVDMAMWGSEKL